MKDAENKFPWQGMLIVTILMVAGLLILYFTGCFSIKNYNELYNYVYVHGSECVLSIFFIGMALYCWILYVRNVLIKPKIEILYLHSKDKDCTCKFIDKNGKSFDYSNDNNYIVNRYYEVSKTHDYIYEVLTVSTEVFDISEEKKSYWLNFYSPIGNFENICLLPIVYVIALLGILSFFMAKGFSKIYGVIFSVVPVFIIIYDLIYKIRLRRENVKTIEDGINKVGYVFVKIYSILRIIIMLNIETFLIWLFIKNSDNITRLMLSPFVICGTCGLGYEVGKIFNNHAMMKILRKVYNLSFLLFWFGILIPITKQIIFQRNYLMLLFLAPFWIGGIFLVYKNFMKK